MYNTDCKWSREEAVFLQTFLRIGTRPHSWDRADQTTCTCTMCVICVYEKYKHTGAYGYYIHAYVYMHIRIYACMYVCVYIYTHAHTDIHARARAHPHTRACATFCVINAKLLQTLMFFATRQICGNTLIKNTYMDTYVHTHTYARLN
jgi:hypothetical protein